MAPSLCVCALVMRLPCIGVLACGRLAVFNVRVCAALWRALVCVHAAALSHVTPRLVAIACALYVYWLAT
jgi:hypothetical protein